MRLIKEKLQMSSMYTPIFTESQTGIHGGFSNFELSLLVWNATYVAQILCGLSYKI